MYETTTVHNIAILMFCTGYAAHVFIIDYVMHGQPIFFVLPGTITLIYDMIWYDMIHSVRATYKKLIRKWDNQTWLFAHFGLPWVRPWDNRGKFYMDGKRIQCWSNASQHIPIYLQPFTSYSEILVRNCNFSLPLAFNAPVEGDPLGRSSWFLVGELPDGQATIWRKNIPEKLNPLSRVHARHRRQTDRRICLAINQT